MIRRLKFHDAIEIAHVVGGGPNLRPISDNGTVIIRATYGRSPR